MCKKAYFLGVDVGTGSVRAALVSEAGRVLRTSVKKTKTWSYSLDFYEQSSDDIWQACVSCIKEVLDNFDGSLVKGIGFDATCSLVCLDETGRPLTVSLSGENERNIILWMDHRAKEQANLINQLNHPVLKYVGGKISPEMQTPKLLWLKNNLRETYDKAGYFFDLPDYLTYRATKCDSRSACSLICKWTYEPQGWNQNYLQQIGLGELQNNNYKRIGQNILPPGSPVGLGLSSEAAKELGLKPGTPVGTSMIDAHAGGLGLIGCKVEGLDQNFTTRLGLICGTSTCHMAVSEEPVFASGVWGPYKDAMVPGLYLNEGGQSATGKLIDFIIDSHPASSIIKKKLTSQKKHIQEYLNGVLKDLATKNDLSSVDLLTKDFHVYPDFHGNRSPFADPSLKGMISGLSLACDEESLALLYLATIQALSYGTKHILETLKKSGYKNIKSTLICGGLSKNPIFTQTQADVCNLPVICPEEMESVLVGAAILGACSASHFDDVQTAITSMGGRGKVVEPNKSVLQFHEKKYQVYLKMYDHQIACRKLMLT